MFKYTKSNTKSKGQWFLISAVIISYSLLTIFSTMYSFIENKYFWNLINNNGYTIRNIENYLNRTTLYENNDIEINESIYFLEKNLASRGIYANITYSHLSGNNIRYKINITSDKYQIYRVIDFP